MQSALLSPSPAEDRHPTPSGHPLISLLGSRLQEVDAVIRQRLHSDEAPIEELAAHLIASGGKRLRPALTLACASLCGNHGTSAVNIAASIELIHSATLLHDDVVDASHLRRGKPTANAVWGNKASVLVGDFLLSQAFQLMVEHGDLSVLQILSKASAVIAEGEIMQLNTTHDPTIAQERYLQVIAAKTAALFAAACELGAVAANTQEHAPALRKFGELAGIAFQIVDDALDYVAEEQQLGKHIGDDFREGKITLPVLLAYQTGDSGEQAFWEKTLNKPEPSEEDLKQALALIHTHQAIDRSIEIAGNYCKQAKQLLFGLPQGKENQALQDTLDFCMHRVY